MTPTILVAGTWAWKDNGATDWYCPGHPFGVFLGEHGVKVCYDGAKPFVWSTGLGGVPLITGKTVWPAGGAALAYFQDECKCDAPNAIVHSHGLQVAAYAAAEHGMRFKTLISVSSPIRNDMAERYAALRKNTGYWLHIHSDASDEWQWRGELFDTLNPFKWRVHRTAPLADKNDFIPKVGHSDVLYDPTKYHYWIERGWLDSLKG